MTIFLCRCEVCGRHFSSQYADANRCNNHPRTATEKKKKKGDKK